MRGLLKTSSTFGFACLGAFLGAGAFVILTLRGDGAPPPAYDPDLTPADAVAFRFPFDWNEATANPAPAEIISASYTGVAAQQELLNPRPTYQLASATGYLPTMAYAPEKTATAVAKVEPTAHPSQTTAAPAQIAKASVATAPAKPAAPRNTRQVLNAGQIAGIKRRLNLTPDQERYWPAVEVALRQMAWSKSGKGEAKVDMTTVDVDGLKTAAFPLVMSFSDDQKRELRSLAHLLGLESVASRF